MPTRRIQDINRLVTEALAIEAEAAKEAGQLGFMCRALAQATMPHRRTTETVFSRRNGGFFLRMAALSEAGLPYGTIPRLLMSWVTTEAVRQKNRDLILGESLREFMLKLKIPVTGGPRGYIGRFRSQTRRLFSTAISCTYTSDDYQAGGNFTLTDDYQIWWDVRNPGQAGLWTSRVRLSERFYEEATQNPVPIDMRALHALRQSPLAIDIYTWLTYRMSYLRRRTSIPWWALQAQFGAGYSHTRQFRAAFNRHLSSVLTIYPDARVTSLKTGIELLPSPSHVAPLK